MINTAVIPAAGLGTRMLPAAKAVPKELLPVVDRPAIQYVVEEAALAGAGEVVLVSSPRKRAVEEHFQPDPELSARLASSGKADLLRSIDELIARVRVTAVDQPRQLGLGDAVGQSRGRVDGPFLCLLGDAIFSGEVLPAVELARAHARLGGSVIGLERVPPEKVSRYGVVAGREIEPGLLRLDDLVEKPSRDTAPSNLAIAARYVLSPAIFECIDRVAPGAGGEIQLTDAIRLLLQREPVHAVVLSARRHDIGNPIDWLAANLAFAARRGDVWEKIAPIVHDLSRRAAEMNREKNPTSP